MSILVYYLMIHLCVSMHACNSRHIGVFHKESEKEVHLTKKTTSEIVAGIEVRNVNEVNIMEKKFEFFSDDVNMNTDNHDLMRFAGSDIKGWKNHARLTMESKKKDSKEKIDNSKDNSVTEDVGVMDYAQPHRKPPIHNLQP